MAGTVVQRMVVTVVVMVADSVVMAGDGGSVE